MSEIFVTEDQPAEKDQDIVPNLLHRLEAIEDKIRQGTDNASLAELTTERARLELELQKLGVKYEFPSEKEKEPTYVSPTDIDQFVR